MSLEEIIEAAVERAVARSLDRHARPVEVQPELMRLKDAAKLAHVSVDTIRAWLEEGLLNRYGSSHAVRVRRDELLNVRPKPKEPEKSPEQLAKELLGKGGGR